VANQEHLAILKQGVKRWNQWRKEHAEVKPDLSRAGLQGTYLQDANLSRAHLVGADLSDAHLIQANLSRANLKKAGFSGACRVISLLWMGLIRCDCPEVGGRVNGVAIVGGKTWVVGITFILLTNSWHITGSFMESTC
jgi:hypothetical protein